MNVRDLANVPKTKHERVTEAWKAAKRDYKDGGGRNWKAAKKRIKRLRRDARQSPATSLPKG